MSGFLAGNCRLKLGMEKLGLKQLLAVLGYLLLWWQRLQPESKVKASCPVFHIPNVYICS